MQGNVVCSGILRGNQACKCQRKTGLESAGEADLPWMVLRCSCTDSAKSNYQAQKLRSSYRTLICAGDAMKSAKHSASQIALSYVVSAEFLKKNK